MSRPKEVWFHNISQVETLVRCIVFFSRNTKATGAKMRKSFWPAKLFMMRSLIEKRYKAFQWSLEPL